MKLLHVLKSEPDEKTRTLMTILSEGNEAVELPLYGPLVDYEALIDEVFASDKVVSWW